MQDKYSGDFGDFVKIGLLRALMKRRHLGVAWYRFPDEFQRADGKHISYLLKEENRIFDPELFDHLNTIARGKRLISSLRPMLEGAVFYDDSLDVSRVPYKERRAWRSAWFLNMTEKLSACDLIFCDPDNGIVDDGDNRKGKINYGKYISLSEIKHLSEGRSVVIYHHNTRFPGGHDMEVNHILNLIDAPTLAVRSTSFSPRTFFIVNPDENMRIQIDAFCENWKALKVRLHVPKFPCDKANIAQHDF